MKEVLNKANREIPYSKYRQFLIIKTLAQTGLRVSELVNLKPQDLNVNTSMIYVPAGKGAARFVDVDPDLIRELLIYVRNENIRKNGRIFPITRQAVGNLTRRRTQLNPHAYRHTYALALFEKTQNVKYVKHQLGHSSIKVTEIYLEGMSFKREKELMKDLFR